MRGDFDAIVTDPPYGLMEAASHHPHYMPLAQRLASLQRLASRRLKLGGRLVFLLPLPAGSEAREALPEAGLLRSLRVESISRQPMSVRMHRLLVTMEKVAEPDDDAEADAEGAAAAANPLWDQMWTSESAAAAAPS